MQEKKAHTMQEKWTLANNLEREQALIKAGQSTYFAKDSWSKLKHMVKLNLELHGEL